MYGYRIIEDPNMVDTVEDWSNVRSPARAKRRRWRHRQRIVYKQVPKPNAVVIEAQRIMVMHPDLAAAIKAKIDQFSDGWKR